MGLLGFQNRPVSGAEIADFGYILMRGAGPTKIWPETGPAAQLPSQKSFWTSGHTERAHQRISALLPAVSNDKNKASSTAMENSETRARSLRAALASEIKNRHSGNGIVGFSKSAGFWAGNRRFWGSRRP